MTIRELIKKNNCEELVFKGKCHDCEREIEVIASINGNEILMEGGAVYSVDQPCTRPDGIYIKCIECYKKNSVFKGGRLLETSWAVE